MLRKNTRIHSIFLKRQFLWAALGFLFLLMAMHFDYGFFRRFSKLAILISLALLILVLFPQFGRLAGGARRWLGWRGLSFQPGELAKLSLVLYLADFCSRKGRF